MEQLLWTWQTACAVLQIGRTHLYELAARGEIVSVKIGRSRRFDAASVREYHARLIERAKARQAEVA